MVPQQILFWVIDFATIQKLSQVLFCKTFYHKSYLLWKLFTLKNYPSDHPQSAIKNTQVFSFITVFSLNIFKKAEFSYLLHLDDTMFFLYYDLEASILIIFNITSEIFF